MVGGEQKATCVQIGAQTVGRVVKKKRFLDFEVFSSALLLTIFSTEIRRDVWHPSPRFFVDP